MKPYYSVLLVNALASSVLADALSAERVEQVVARFARAFDPLGQARFTIRHEGFMDGGRFERETRTLDAIEHVVFDRRSGRWSVHTEGTTTFWHKGKLLSQRIANQYVTLPEAVIYAQRDGESLIVSATLNRAKADPPIDYLYGSAIFYGYILSDYGRGLIDILRESSPTAETATFDGREVVLLQARGSHGERRLWLSPDQNYLPLKITMAKSQNNIHGTKTVGSTQMGGNYPELYLKSISLTIEPIEVRRIDNAYIPWSVSQAFEYRYVDGSMVTNRSVHRIENLQLNPDFSSPDVFKVAIEIPNGTPVDVTEAPNINHLWENGRIVKGIDPKVMAALEGVEYVGESSTSWRTWLVLGFALVAIVAVVVVYRGQRRER
jgi:hypothetical protein